MVRSPLRSGLFLHPCKTLSLFLLLCLPTSVRYTFSQGGHKIHTHLPASQSPERPQLHWWSPEPSRWTYPPNPGRPILTSSHPPTNPMTLHKPPPLPLLKLLGHTGLTPAPRCHNLKSDKQQKTSQFHSQALSGAGVFLPHSLLPLPPFTLLYLSQPYLNFNSWGANSFCLFHAYYHQFQWRCDLFTLHSALFPACHTNSNLKTNFFNIK
jgi:hypothetical protein